MRRLLILNIARMMLLASAAILPAQMFAPGSVDWKQVDFSACGDFPANGRSVKVSQIERSADPQYVPIDPALLSYRKMGDKPMAFDPFAVARMRVASADCWPVELWRDAFAVIALRCTRCHDGSRMDKLDWHGGLDMRTRAAMIRGGKSGPALQPGSTAGSLLYQRILPIPSAVRAASPVDVPMQEPPNGALFGPEVEAIRVWIANGAPEPK